MNKILSLLPSSIPELGTLLLAVVLAAAGYTFGVALAAGNGRPRLLQAARKGAYGTVALVAVAVLLLAYAFITHDFRLDYVARYSDRTMTTPWLVAALWGGQDGSLLWWLFLTSLFSGLCVWWLGGRYRELQPFVIATLMSVVIFVTILMLFSANPFRTLVAGAVPDGRGLNFQLRNFYMIVHPPSLYIGFTSAAVPFAFAIAALVTGRLDNEWIVASRKWMLFSWLFLSIGNFLGMLWAYEELGWGGYWAWDPVENAAFFPWITASAYVHSVMIQERRGMLKLWNVTLICLTFLLTYFGTFLTRSGLIASVHSFAKSGIGAYFLYYMFAIIALCVSLIIWRAGKLYAKGRIESPLSREFMFVLNNWILLFLMIFVVTATVWPRISEWLWNQKATIGPSFYNAFVPFIGLMLIFLMGTAPLLGWRKTSRQLLIKSFRWPLGALSVTALLHLTLGPRLGFPAFITVDPIYDGPVGQALAFGAGKLPLITTSLVAYNFAVVIQEFQRGVASRRLNKEEGVLTALFNLVAKSRRRHGGYIVHVGIAVMFLGFVGRAWESKSEVEMRPGDTVQIAGYDIHYKGTRAAADHEKRMVFAGLEVSREGRHLALLEPAQYIYKGAMRQMSTEIDRYSTIREDLYVSLGSVNSESKLASFRIHINPLVSFVWLGLAFLIVGAGVSMWPETSLGNVTTFGYLKPALSVASMVMLSLILALAPSQALGQQQNMRREGVVVQTKEERLLFKQLLCNCGTCPKEPLESCTCGWAHRARGEAREKLTSGTTIQEIVREYAGIHGADATIVQATRGKNQLLWAVPITLALAGVGFIYRLGKAWRRDDEAAVEAAGDKAADDQGPDEYDEQLDAELRDLE